MKLRSFFRAVGPLLLLVLSACGDAPEAANPEPATPATPAAPAAPATPTETKPAEAPRTGTAEDGGEDAPIVIEASKSLPQPAPVAEAPVPAPDGARPLTPEEQSRVLDGVLQARARQQAEGLGTGRVVVNGAWPYTGYSTIAPDPAAAIEARLVAVDVTVSGHTPFFDIDDIEIVDGASLMSYGSDPHAEPLRPDGSLLPLDEEVPVAPAASRWLLIYAFPKATPRFQLYYWGKALTTGPVAFGDSGLSLPYPPAE